MNIATEGNIAMDLREISLGCMNWINLVQKRDKYSWSV